jgi:hypothetical protein
MANAAVTTATLRELIIHRKLGALGQRIVRLI